MSKKSIRMVGITALMALAAVFITPGAANAATSAAWVCRLIGNKTVCN